MLRITKFILNWGARAFCSRWVDDILGKEEHLSIAIDRKGIDAVKSINQMVAKLLAHGVTIDLKHFYQSVANQKTQKRILKKELQTGGVPFREYVAELKGTVDFKLTKKEKAVPVLAEAWGGEPTTTYPVAETPIISNKKESAITTAPEIPSKMMIAEKQNTQKGGKRIDDP